MIDGLLGNDHAGRYTAGFADLGLEIRAER
jgi:hypothetical protein